MATDTIYERLSAVIQSMQQVYDLADQVIAGPAGATVTYPDGSEINTLRESLARFQADLDAITGQAGTDADFVNAQVSQFFGGIQPQAGAATAAQGAKADSALQDPGLFSSRNPNGVAATDYGGVQFKSANSLAYQIIGPDGEIKFQVSINGIVRAPNGEIYVRNNLVRHAGNTTIDSNGFIKSASPIVKLYADRVENDGGAAAVFEKLATGHYRFTGTNGFAQDGWFIESPTDANGTIKCYLEYAQHDDHSIEVWTYQPLFDQGFAQPGPPIDIPAGRWIDIRLNESDATDITPPPSAVPLTAAEKLAQWRARTAVSKLQLIRAINTAGARDQFNTALESADPDTLDGWTYASQINRTDPLVAGFAQAVGYTDTDLDDLFKAAAQMG